jgi:hypothetical protein
LHIRNHFRRGPTVIQDVESPAAPTQQLCVPALIGFVSANCSIFFALAALLGRTDILLLPTGVFLIAAILLGIVAWKRIERSGKTLSGTGFAVGSVLIPLAAFVIGFLLLPAT